MSLVQEKTDLVKRVKLSAQKLNLIVRCFIADTTATQASKITLSNRNTVNRYYKFFRSLIVAQSTHERESIDLHNGIEADESYFGPTRQRGKRGRGASNKIIVFGLRKRDNNVYAEIINGATRDEIMPIILATVKSGSDIYTDGWRSYDALAVYGYNHKKVIHEANQFAE